MSSDPDPEHRSEQSQTGETALSQAPADSLLVTAGIIGGHLFIEQQLFALTGRWSNESATTDGAARCCVLLATQSQLHAWRLAQWQDRSPRSVETAEIAPPGWAAALEVAAAATSVEVRTACWVSVLAPQLAARYLQHRREASGPASEGLRRWLDIAMTDVLGGIAQGALALQGVEFVRGGAADTLDEALRALTSVS